MNFKNRLLAGVSALALITATAACDAPDNVSENNTVIVANDTNAAAAVDDDATNRACATNTSTLTDC